MTQRQLSGVPVVEFTPPEVRRKGVIVFFHGGSYIFGSARTSHADIIAELAPFHAELKGLAKLFVQAGDAERLIDECREFAQRASLSGVDVELDVVPDMPHNPPVLAAFHPAARGALDRLARFIGDQLPESFRHPPMGA